MADILTWFEADSTRRKRVIPIYSHGALYHPGFAAPRAITLENLRRLRALGGFMGFSVSPPFYWSASAETQARLARLDTLDTEVDVLVEAYRVHGRPSAAQEASYRS